VPRYIDPREAAEVMRKAGGEPLEPYPGASVGWLVRCLTCGSENRPHYSSVRQGTGVCKRCGNRRAQDKNRGRYESATASRLLKFGFEALEEVQNQKLPAKVRCLSCGEIQLRHVQNILAVCKCSRTRQPLPKGRSLADAMPEVNMAWDSEKNDLEPSEILWGTNKKYFFVCELGHSYKMAVSAWRRPGRGCPVCSNSQVRQGFNDLKSQAPELDQEWHPSKNEGLEPSGLVPHSNRKVWWLGSCGHEWEASPNKRTSGRGCPVCQNLRLVPGVNDLATTHPLLVSEWHPTRNGHVRPESVVWGTPRKVWWLGACSHEWESSVVGRASARASGCPFCGGRKILPGFNDVASLPIAQDWDYQKNKVSVEKVNRGTPRKVWWKCDSGHSYQMQVNLKVKRPKSCPVCSRRVLQIGVNDLATTHPDLLAEWDIAKNSGLDPTSITSGSRKKAWWKCDRGHSWAQAVEARQKFGCPYCSGRYPILGETDLATTHPLLVEEWHPSRNSKAPSEVSFGSEYKAWWSGPCGHEWLQPVGVRVKGSGCPECAPVGYSSLSPGLLYFVIHPWSAGKIGITNVDARQSRLEALKTVGFEVVEIWQREDGQIIRDLETKALRWVRRDLGLPPYFGKEEMGRVGGWSETFSLAELSTEDVCSKISELLAQLEETK